jgi:4a-hydroxytetrahydrobiopterin dehydratase
MRIIITEKQAETLKKHWKKVDNKKFVKKYHFDSYDDLVTFVKKVTDIAKKQNHHPEIKFGYDFLEISITDHEKGGISDKCHKFISSVDKISE